MNYPDNFDKQLAKAFLTLKTEKEVLAFMRDLMTISEIKEFSKRYRIAEFLQQGELSYKQIATQVQASTATVTRVNEWLNKQNQKGYKTAIHRLNRPKF